MKRISGRPAALVTGASSGIGYELAGLLARDGHDLVLVARDKARLDRLAQDLRSRHGVTVRVIPKDLSVDSSPDEIFDELNRDGVAIGVLVNNAGFDVYGDFSESDADEERRMIQVNVAALTRMAKRFLPGMRDRGCGRILNVGSTASFIPIPLNAVYGATKAYVRSFSLALAEELEGTGVTVTVLCPGVTRTEFFKRANMEGSRLLKFGMMDARAVAEAGYRALMSGRRAVVPGLMNKFLVFLARVVPAKVMTRATKYLMKAGNP